MMRPITAICALTLLTIPCLARADCAADLDTALIKANKLPQNKGKNAVLEEIERARTARHEGDEAGCQEQINDVLALLRESDKAYVKPAK